MKHLILCLLVISACSKKYEVTRTIEGKAELTRLHVLIKKIHEKCVDYVVPQLKQEVVDDQIKWREELEDKCRKDEDIVECVRKASNLRLEMLEHDCSIETNDKVSQQKPFRTYKYIANCGEKGCAGVDGKMEFWEITPELILLRAENNVRGSKCKCELNGVKNNQGYFIKFTQPSSVCDGTMAQTKIGWKIDIDSCGYCCGANSGLRGEWMIRKESLNKSESTEKLKKKK